MGLNC